MLSGSLPTFKVDLHDIRNEDRLTTLLEDATSWAVRTGLIPVEPGQYVQILDEEDNTCLALVEEVTENEIIRLKVDWSTWIYATPKPDLVLPPLGSSRSGWSVYEIKEHPDTMLDPDDQARVVT
jgi:hypothetical protein